MSEQRMKMLRRYRVHFQEIVASREDIGMRRARSDGQITMLLSELALLLPVDEWDLVQEMIRLHNALWEVSPAALAQLVRPRAGS